MGGIYVDFSVVNQLNSPALNSNTFANRPSAGQAGRLFVSTDTFEIYRDNGTTWDLIGGPGTSTITGTGTAGNFPIFTSSQVIGNSEMYYTEGANFNNINFGYTGAGGKYNTTELNIFSNNESRILLQFDSNKYAQLSNEFGNVYLGANNLGIHGFNNVFYYNGSSTTDRYLSFQTEGLDRLTIEQNGDLQLNKYTTDGFLRTSGANGTLSIDTNTYVTSNIYTADGTLSAARTVSLNNHTLRFEGNANTARVRLSADNNVARILSFATADSQRWAFRVDGNETGSNTGANLQLRRYDDTGTFIDASLIINRQTGKKTFNAIESYTTGFAYGNSMGYTLNVPNGTTFSTPNSISPLLASVVLNLNGNATIPNANRSGVDAYNAVNFLSAGTLTLNQATTLRALSSLRAGWAFTGTAVGTITHNSGMLIMFPTNTGSALNITNNYALLINSQTPNIGTINYTNRWGIYQEGATDLNYFAANVLVGSNIDNGARLQVSGNTDITGTIKTGAPTGGTAQTWKLGSVVTQAVGIDDSNYVEVEINGVFKQLAIVVSLPMLLLEDGFALLQEDDSFILEEY